LFMGALSAIESPFESPYGWLDILIYTR